LSLDAVVKDAGHSATINKDGRKSKPLNLTYDPKTHTLSFAPDGVGLYLGP
jgi:hypothetical protein